jgi:hypothetical protein
VVLDDIVEVAADIALAAAAETAVVVAVVAAVLLLHNTAAAVLDYSAADLPESFLHHCYLLDCYNSYAAAAAMAAAREAAE